jgi:hypothetical protein
VGRCFSPSASSATVAWARGAPAVAAHTLPHLEPFMGVLRKLGSAPAESPEPGVLAFALQRG